MLKTASSGERESPPVRRIAFAALVGTAIESYDFLVYGTAAALVFPKVFFSELGAAAGTISSLATFAVAFFLRPAGAVLFGHLGDRLGRKRTLLYTLLLMGLASAAVGLLPGSEAIGVAAPITLVILRCAQGLAIGGEWGGAALLTAEYAPPDERGRRTGLIQLAPGISVTLSGVTFLVSGLWLSHAAFVTWGWRIPFLLGAALVAVGVFVRMRVAETPVFQTMSAAQRDGASPLAPLAQAAPLTQAVKTHARPIVLAGGAMCAAFGSSYVAAVFLTGYATTVLGLTRTTVLSLTVVGGVVLILSAYTAARASDRRGRRPVLLVGGVATICCGLGVFPLIDTRGVLQVGIGLCLLQACGGICLGPTGALLPELFPTGHRYTGASLSYNLGAVAGGGVPLIVAAVLREAIGSYAVGVLVALLGLLTTLCTFALPETKGVRL